MLWRCAACKAKDEEIAHLMALLHEANERSEKANARVAEIVSPGVVVRATPRAAPLPPSRPPAREQIAFPGYEAEFAPPPPEIVG